MKIFGKSLSEYVAFQKGILILIVFVAGGRLALSMAGLPNSAVKWLSVTAAMILGSLYYAIKVPQTKFGGYRHLLPLLVIQDFLAQAIVATGIIISIYTGKNNIYSAPEYSGGGDGKNWQHVIAHLVIGIIIAPLVFWGVTSLIVFVVKKASAADKDAATAPGV